MKNKNYVIVRADRAGVFFGELDSRNGSEVVMSNCRKVHYWDGAASVEQLSVDGTARPDSCRLTVKVDNATILGVIQVLPCTEKSIKSLNSVKEWKR